MTSGVSVVIPVFNGAAYLAECVQSVARQTLATDEIIIVDDGSTDDTPNVVRSLSAEVRCIRQENHGLSSARNVGQRAVRTDYVAFVDCDDLWAPAKLERQMAALAAEKKPSMCYGYVTQFVSPDLSGEEAARLKFDPEPMAGYSATTLLLGNDAFARAGPFDESLEIGEFAEWFARAKDAGVQTILIDDVVAMRRLHRSNMGRRGQDFRSNYSKSLKKVLDRRRLAK